MSAQYMRVLPNGFLQAIQFWDMLRMAVRIR